MSEKDNDKPEQPEAQKKQEEPKDVVLTITLSSKTGIGVQGPGNGKLYDEPMCFYLLEKGKDFIKQHNARENSPKILNPGRFTAGAFGRRR